MGVQGVVGLLYERDPDEKELSAEDEAVATILVLLKGNMNLIGVRSAAMDRCVLAIDIAEKGTSSGEWNRATKDAADQGSNERSIG